MSQNLHSLAFEEAESLIDLVEKGRSLRLVEKGQKDLKDIPIPLEEPILVQGRITVSF